MKPLHSSSLHLAGFFFLSLLYARSAPAADSAPLRPWNDYRVIMWIEDSPWKKPEKIPLFFQRMHEMGVNTGMLHHDADPKEHVDNKFPFYVENIVNRGLCLKYNSHVTDWSKFVTAWAKKRDEAGLVRDYSLDDPAWLASAVKDMQHTVRQDMAHQPLAYDIRDELSTTISANPFDYDFSPITFAAFRKWLEKEYGSIAALNQEWQTEFKDWSDVKPFTTDQIKNRMSSGDALPRGNPDWQALEALKFDPAEAIKQPTRWNFAPWCDFRTYMDLSLATALDNIRQSSRAIDPQTPVGIEGTQMPSAFGGYDLWRLSQAIDWVEAYDIGNSREIFGSFMPGKAVITTVFEKNASHAQRRLWHLLLEGDKGCIVWWSEDCFDWKSDDYALTPKAKALAPVFKEMTGPIASLFLRAEREFDPIAILYSHPSIQVDWLLESTVDGSTWLRRFSSYESENNRLLKVRDGWLKALTDLGYSPKFVSSQQIENGELAKQNYVACVLPGAFALTDKEAAALAAFAKGPQHVLFCDGKPGQFDGHGRLRAEDAPFKALPAVASNVQAFAIRDASSPGSSEISGDIAKYPGERLAADPKFAWPQWVSKNLHEAPLTVTVPLESRTAVFRYRLGKARLLAFERNIDYQMSEDLKQAGGNESLEKPAEITAQLKAAAHVYDLRANKYLGLTDKIQITLDPWHPALYALVAERLPNDNLDALGK